MAIAGGPRVARLALTIGRDASVTVHTYSKVKDQTADFTDGQDRHDLQACHFASFASARSHFQVATRGVAFASGTDTVLGTNLTMAHLTAAHLIL